jgi:hypothetical protein
MKHFSRRILREEITREYNIKLDFKSRIWWCRQTTFRRNISPACYLLQAGFLLGFVFNFVKWVETESTWCVSHYLDYLYQPRVIDGYGAVGGMRIGGGNRSTRRKPAPVPLCPPQIPHDLTWDRTRAAVVVSRRLTAWVRARPLLLGLLFKH